MVLLGKYSGNILFIPNLAFLKSSPTHKHNPPAIPDFYAHFAAYGLTPAKMGSVAFQSSLDYRFLSKSILDGIHDSSATPERKQEIQLFLEYTLYMIAEAFSAGDGLLTNDGRFARRYGIELETLGDYVYVVKYDWVLEVN